uniref:Uncharacterized protein n=1 Tax=Panagrolaimus sp. PS1159 TaxID=55785 RepID=A0AC35EV06_9BILA
MSHKRLKKNSFFKHEYERVNSDPTLNDSEPFTMHSSDDGVKQTLLTPGSNRAAFDPAEIEETAQSTSHRDSDYELEQYEMDDHIGDIPHSFNRRHRRVSLKRILKFLNMLFME